MAERRIDPAVVTGTPSALHCDTPVPISRNFEESEGLFETDLRVGFNWSHEFDANWTLTQRFDADFRRLSPPALNTVPGNPDSSNCTLLSCPIQRVLVDQPLNSAQDYYTSLDLTGHFTTFGLAHTLLVGGDFYLDNEPFASRLRFTNVPPIDLFHPVHSGNLEYLLADPELAMSGNLGQDWYGIYVQDQVTLPYNFHMLAGFRYDNAGQHRTTIQTVPTYGVTGFSFHENAIKPRFGLLWQPIPQLSFYGSYVENFGLTNGLAFANNPLPPTEARQWEAGVKADLLDNRLTATASWFDIVKTNVASPSPDPALAALGVQVATGAVRNTGVEFDIQGQITPELKTIGSFAYINSKIIKDTGLIFDVDGNPVTTTGNTGNRLFGVPALGGSLWAVYEPQFEPIRGLALGAGFIARSNVEVDNANSLALPSYAIMNVMARYSFEVASTKMSLQLNINNLLDKVYFLSSSFPSRGIQPGIPRTLLGSFKVEF